MVAAAAEASSLVAPMWEVPSSVVAALLAVGVVALSWVWALETLVLTRLLKEGRVPLKPQPQTSPFFLRRPSAHLHQASPRQAPSARHPAKYCQQQLPVGPLSKQQALALHLLLE